MNKKCYKTTVGELIKELEKYGKTDKLMVMVGKREQEDDEPLYLDSIPMEAVLEVQDPESGKTRDELLRTEW